MNTTPAPATTTDTFILAGRNDDGVWHKIESASLEDGDTADEVRTFLQTMAHASSRNFADLEIMTEGEFVRRGGGSRKIAA